MQLDWDTISQIATLLGVVAVTLGYAYGQFTKGRMERRKEDVQSKKDVFQLLQDQVNELEEMVKNQKDDILVLQTQNTEKDKKIKEYMELIQNRNPEMLKFMAYLTKTAESSEAYMKDTGLVFSEIKKVLGDIGEHMEKTNQHLARLEPK